MLIYKAFIILASAASILSPSSSNLATTRGQEQPSAVIIRPVQSKSLEPVHDEIIAVSVPPLPDTAPPEFQLITAAPTSDVLEARPSGKLYKQLFDRPNSMALIDRLKIISNKSANDDLPCFENIQCAKILEKGSPFTVIQEEFTLAELLIRQLSLKGYISACTRAVIATYRQSCSHAVSEDIAREDKFAYVSSSYRTYNYVSTYTAISYELSEYEQAHINDLTRLAALPRPVTCDDSIAPLGETELAICGYVMHFRHNGKDVFAYCKVFMPDQAIADVQDCVTLAYNDGGKWRFANVAAYYSDDRGGGSDDLCEVQSSVPGALSARRIAEAARQAFGSTFSVSQRSDRSWRISGEKVNLDLNRLSSATARPWGRVIFVIRFRTFVSNPLKGALDFQFYLTVSARPIGNKSEAVETTDNEDSVLLPAIENRLLGAIRNSNTMVTCGM